jgi:hypothetical protein
MTNQDQAQLDQAEREIEISIEQAKEMVDRKDKMDELIANPAFNDIFTIGYMEKESTRLVSLLADSDWQEESKQQSLLDDMRAISGLRQYIMNIRALGRQMERQIEASQATLEELRIDAEGE